MDIDSLKVQTNWYGLACGKSRFLSWGKKVEEPMGRFDEQKCPKLIRLAVIVPCGRLCDYSTALLTIVRILHR